MIDVYFWPTGNGKKITIMLEECGLPYRVIPVNINKGEQHTAAFQDINPNGRMPAIIDHDTGAPPITVFESGAILQYLAEKTGRLLPADTAGRYRVLQWVFWQVGGLGPMAGQAHHFLRYAPQKLEYPMHRFRSEVTRLYTVMERQLATHEHLAGDYSIADIAAWPWVVRHEWQGQDLKDYPNVRRWFEAVGARAAVRRGADIGRDWTAAGAPLSDEERRRLFNLRDEDLVPVPGQGG